MSAAQDWNLGDEMRRARLAFFASGGIGTSDLAITEEHRAEGLVARVVEILTDLANPSRLSLPAYQLAARMAFETAAENAVQPVGRP